MSKLQQFIWMATAVLLLLTYNNCGKAPAPAATTQSSLGTLNPDGSNGLEEIEIITQPKSATFATGYAMIAGDLCVEAEGLDLKYQWMNTAGAIADETKKCLFVGKSLAANHSGDYRVVVSGYTASIETTVATLTVTPPPTPAPTPTPPPTPTPAPVAPTITQQLTAKSYLVGRIIAAGDFCVAANSPDAITYAWTNTATGVAVAGETGPCLFLGKALVETNTGNYQVAVTSVGGRTLSAIATLTVTTAVVAPAIATDLSGKTFAAGKTLAAGDFCISTSGSDPKTYAWINVSTGAILGGENRSCLFVGRNLSPSDGGSYQVRVSNSAGTVLSAAATLTVSAPVVITTPAINTPPPSPNFAAGKVLAAGDLCVTASGGELIYRWYNATTGAALAGETARCFFNLKGGASPIALTATDNGLKLLVVVSNPMGAVPSATVTVGVQ